MTHCRSRVTFAGSSSRSTSEQLLRPTCKMLLTSATVGGANEQMPGLSHMKMSDSVRQAHVCTCRWGNAINVQYEPISLHCLSILMPRRSLADT
jgi:hypothetical protein